MTYSINGKPHDLKSLVKLSLTYYGAGVKSLFGLLLLFVIVKDCNLYYTQWISNTFLLQTLNVLQWILMFSLWSVGYCHVDQVLNGGRRCYSSMKELAIKVFFVILFVLLAVVLLFVIAKIVWLAMKFFHHFFHQRAYAPIVFLSAVSFPLAYVVTRQIFTVPIIMVNNENMFEATQHSAELVLNYLLRAFKVLVYGGFIFLISEQSTYHAHALVRYHLNIPVDFAVLLITLPGFYLVSLLLMDDLQYRSDLIENAVE